ncbi:hypothetical protein GCM10028824_41550 [Hymenobacter segetis]
MMLLRPVAWFLLIGILGCQPQAGHTPAFAPTGGEGFAVPVLTQAPSAMRHPRSNAPDTVLRVWPSFVGRYAFAPSIALEHPDSVSGRDYLAGRELNRLEESDSLTTDGLEVLADYGRTILDVPLADSVAHRTYPVYVANATPRTKYLYGWSSGVYAIQEAKDRAGFWRPIERMGSAWCGNGAWALALRSRHMAVFLARKYDGPFATRLRIRLQNGESRYVTGSYPGRIDERQFTVSRQEFHYLEENHLAFYPLYFGAKPDALDSIEQRQWRKSDGYRLMGNP